MSKAKILRKLFKPKMNEFRFNLFVLDEKSNELRIIRTETISPVSKKIK